ncbi:MAG: cell division protein FtsA [Kiritimatiellae bacterium]|nr:cell division protein FtsA [Kiritimatiellia bacterium]MDD4622707.1 cell division protein FtsA [Kiritimatiellia bacterium]
MAIPPIAALEIGTSRTVVCVGESGERGRVRITGVGVCPTIGVRKGQIVDLSKVRVGIDKAVKEAEKASGVDIWQVLIALSGGHIQAEVNSGMLAIRSNDHVVSREDMEELGESVNDVLLESDRQLLHTIPLTFTVDDQSGIVKPEGMRCKMLALDVMAIHGLKNRIDNAVNAAKSAKLDVTDVAFSGIGAALSVLTPEHKHNGVALIDLGGGTTSYVAYCNSVFAASGCIAVGGDHITNDVALAFTIPQARAEDVKRRYGSAVIAPDSGNKRVTLPADVGFEERSIGCKALQTVINARVDETLRIVRSRLDDAGVLPHLGAGLILTGGGAYINGVTDLARLVFGLPCRIGVPSNVDGLDGVDQSAALAAVAGLVVHGRNNYEDRGLLSPVKHVLKGWFGR